MPRSMCSLEHERRRARWIHVVDRRRQVIHRVGGFVRLDAQQVPDQLGHGRRGRGLRAVSGRPIIKVLRRLATLPGSLRSHTCSDEVAACLSHVHRSMLYGRTTPGGPIWPRLGSRLSSRPTLLIVGGADPMVLEMNEQSSRRLRCEHRLVVVPGRRTVRGAGRLEWRGARARGHAPPRLPPAMTARRRTCWPRRWLRPRCSSTCGASSHGSDVGRDGGGTVAAACRRRSGRTGRPFDHPCHHGECTDRRCVAVVDPDRPGPSRFLQLPDPGEPRWCGDAQRVVRASGVAATRAR